MLRVGRRKVKVSPDRTVRSPLKREVLSGGSKIHHPGLYRFVIACLDHAERGSFLRAWHVTARADREAVDLDLGDLRH